MIERGEHQGVVALAGDALVGHIAVRPAGRRHRGGRDGHDDRRPRVIAAEASWAGWPSGWSGSAATAASRDSSTSRPPPTRSCSAPRSPAAGARPGSSSATSPRRPPTARSSGRRRDGSRSPSSTSRSRLRVRRSCSRPRATSRRSRRWRATCASHGAGSPPARLPRGRPRSPDRSDRIRSLERATLEHIGADVAEVAAGLADSEQDLVHVDLPMSDVAIDAATEALVAAGFVFAAWLPGWAGHDVLRLQRARPSQRERSGRRALRGRGRDPAPDRRRRGRRPARAELRRRRRAVDRAHRPRRRTDVLRGRADQPPLALLLEDVRRPAGDARAREHAS